MPQYRCGTLPSCTFDACDIDQEVFPSKGCIHAWCIQPSGLVTTITTPDGGLILFSLGFLLLIILRVQCLLWMCRFDGYGEKKSGLVNGKEISFATICSSHFTLLKHWRGWREIPFCKAVAQGKTGGGGSFLSFCWLKWPSSHLASGPRSIPQHTADLSMQGAAPLAVARKFGSFLL